MSAANWLSLHAVRHMHEFGTRREHLGEIALTARAHAALNPAAVYREPLTMEDYLRARMVTWPFGLYDCDVPVDGSTAVVVSAADAARDLPHPAVRINAVGSAIRGRPVWDQWEDLTTMAARDAAAQLWARTDLTPADVDTIQLYDGFSWLTLAWIEALGFCQRGEGGPFVEGGRVRLGGALPLNTWGGQLSGGRLHGFGFLAEAIRQLRGEDHRRPHGQDEGEDAGGRWTPRGPARARARRLRRGWRRRCRRPPTASRASPRRQSRRRRRWRHRRGRRTRPRAAPATDRRSSRRPRARPRPRAGSRSWSRGARPGPRSTRPAGGTRRGGARRPSRRRSGGGSGAP